MSNIQNILKTIKDKEIQFVDLRFTDPRGKMQHVSQHVSTIDEDSLAEKVKLKEHMLYPMVIDMLSSGKIKSP